MKKTFFSFKHLVTLALGLTMSVGAFAYSDAKVQMSVSATSINYGETVNVSVTVDKGAKYLVEIPTDKFSGETFDFTGDGTKENQQKTYTAIACGTATFTLNVTKGTLQGEASQSVTIHPWAPTNLKASNITPTTMDLSWDNNTSATTYKLLLKDENGTTKTIENIGTSTYSLSNLLSNEMYTIDVYSQSAGLESKSAATISAKTLAMPELTVSPSTAEVMQTSLLGKKPTMVYSVSGTNLQDKITLTL